MNDDQDDEDAGGEPSSPEKGFLTPRGYAQYVDGQEQYEVGPHPRPVLDPARAKKFTPAIKEIFLRAYAHTGHQGAAAHICGVTSTTITDHKKADPEFARAMLEAHASFVAIIEREITHQALEGSWEPQFGRVGKDVDGVVGYVKRKKFDALKMLAQRHIPAYRHGHVDPETGVRPGVLVVYPIRTEAEWEKATEGELLPKDPLHGIPGAEGLLLEDKTSRRGRVPDDEE